MLKACLLGFGGIGHVHKNGYIQVAKNEKAELVAVCDIRPESFTSEIAMNISDDSQKAELSFRSYQDLDEMLEKEKPDFVDVCLPTYLHKEKTIYLLKKGYNVICEKPMSLSYKDCLEMLDTAKACGKKLSIGQCLHFFAEYEYLKEVIDSGVYGKPISAFFQRLSAPPVWGWENWFMDETRSGGCILDLHVHDVDISRYLFGEPKAVACHTKNGWAKWDCAHTTLCFDGLTATVIGDWSLPNVPFEASYRVSFEKAVLVCKNGAVTVYPREGEAFQAEIAPKDGYACEVEYFADVINGVTENIKNPPESAAKSIKLIETMRKSAAKGGKLLPFKA